MFTNFEERVIEILTTRYSISYEDGCYMVDTARVDGGKWGGYDSAESIVDDLVERYGLYRQGVVP